MSATDMKFLRIGDVLERVPVSKPTIYRLIERREFPRPIKIGSTSLWPAHEVDQWMESKVAARD